MNTKKAMKICPFCEALSKKNFFTETANFVAVYNLAPILPGHCMIIPKQHTEKVLDLSDDNLSEMIIFSRQVIGILTKAFPSDGFNWTIQDGESAGQTVNHVHLHIIPRKTDDLPEPGDWYPKLKVSRNHDSENRTKLTLEEYKMVNDYLSEITNNLFS